MIAVVVVVVATIIQALLDPFVLAVKVPSTFGLALCIPGGGSSWVLHWVPGVLQAFCGVSKGRLRSCWSSTFICQGNHELKDCPLAYRKKWVIFLAGSPSHHAHHCYIISFFSFRTQSHRILIITLCAAVSLTPSLQMRKPRAMKGWSTVWRPYA
jgi:hypothetical protein